MSHPSKSCPCTLCACEAGSCGCRSEQAERRAACPCCGTNCGCRPTCECSAS